MMTDHGPNAVHAADLHVAGLINQSAALPAGSIRIVDAPAGAGKTGLVTRLIPAYARRGHSVAVVTQTNEQADDLTRRLATEQPRLAIVRLVSAAHNPSPLPANVSLLTNPAHAIGHGPIVATADKWAFSVEALGGTRFRVGIIDEAYQMAGGKLLYIADLFESLDLVGDPGQLSPFSQVDTTSWAGLAVDPTRNAVDTIRRHHDIVPTCIPLTRRLPAHAADLIRPAFYPTLDFAAATALGMRRLATDAANAPTAIDRSIDTALAEGWAMLTLPSKAVPRTDRQLADAIAALAVNLLSRNPRRVHDEHPHLPPTITADRIAIGASHRDQVGSVQRALDAAGLPDVIVDTANRLQGREFDVVIAWHPLSSQPEAGAFHLDVGRLCVLTTRHRHACIVVARAGIDRLLDDCVPVGEGILGEANDRTISGWEANTIVLDHLQRYEVLA